MLARPRWGILISLLVAFAAGTWLGVQVMRGELGSAWAQQGAPGSNPAAAAMSGWPTNRSTYVSSVTITAAGVFQTMLPALSAAVQPVRQQLTINNNNSVASNCWVFFNPGTASATVSNSFLLTQGQSYRRDWPFVPSDAVQATCSITNGTLYFDIE
jgi:redox-sensitive bicupin YhaK (pirin superfamily)